MVSVSLAEDDGPAAPPTVTLSGIDATYPLHALLEFQVTYQDDHDVGLDMIGSDNFQIEPREWAEASRELLFGYRIQLTNLNSRDQGRWAEATFEVVSILDEARPFFVSRFEPGVNENSASVRRDSWCGWPLRLDDIDSQL